MQDLSVSLDSSLTTWSKWIQTQLLGLINYFLAASDGRQLWYYNFWLITAEKKKKSLVPLIPVSFWLSLPLPGVIMRDEPQISPQVLGRESISGQVRKLLALDVFSVKGCCWLAARRLPGKELALLCCAAVHRFCPQYSATGDNTLLLKRRSRRNNVGDGDGDKTFPNFNNILAEV